MTLSEALIFADGIFEGQLAANLERVREKTDDKLILAASELYLRREYQARRHIVKAKVEFLWQEAGSEVCQ